jgi:biotin transport system substrate-specific component|tara:strand:- start:2163 stop:2723 length:561 start_codon:yes stop_codon:yes gene_type:complete
MEAIEKIQINKIAKVILIALLGSFLLAISAKIKIPFYPVPMTMQTFVILFLGITLGSKIGLFTVSIYLLEGIYGIPVFAGTPEKGIGLIYFTGPTMGYLLGFLLTVYFAGLFKYEKGLINTFIKLVFSVSFIYFLGIMWLGILIGWEKPLFKLGAQPFLLAELFKILLLLFLIPSLLKIKKIIKII